MSVSPGIPRMSFTQRPHASMSRLRLLFKIALFLYGILSKTSKLGPNIQIFSRMPLWLAVGLMVYPSIHSLVNWSVGPLVFWSIGPSTADYKAQATCGNWPWKKNWVLPIADTSDASSIDLALKDPQIAFAFCVTRKMAFKSMWIQEFFFFYIKFFFA